jgi:hypothetical protein
MTTSQLQGAATAGDADAEASTESKIQAGCLPAWDTGVLPEPPPIRWVRYLGPGIVLAGGAIGTGEWVMGPKVAASYHGEMLWVVPASIAAQALFNREAMRYTLFTGEPIMTGFMRSKPGPRFWLPLYLVLDWGAWIPASSALVAQLIVVAVLGFAANHEPSPAVVSDMNQLAYVVLFASAIPLLFGRKVYHVVKFILSAKLVLTLAYLAFCCIFFVSAKTWGRICAGLLPTLHPSIAAQEIDWGIVSALAGYAGIGGFANVMASNFVREHGWGMGVSVGSVASIFADKTKGIRHTGVTFVEDGLQRPRVRRWLRLVAIDQYVVWSLASLIGMLLPCLLGAEFLRPDALRGDQQWRFAIALAEGFGERAGPMFKTLTVLCGLLILVGCQISVVDGVARRWSDAVWSCSRRLRTASPEKAHLLYYACVLGYLAFGVLSLYLLRAIPGSMLMQIGGSLANAAAFAIVVHTAYVNRRFLPKSARPGRVNFVAMCAAATFFGLMFALVVKKYVAGSRLTLSATVIRASAVAAILFAVLPLLLFSSRNRARAGEQNAKI